MFVIFSVTERYIIICYFFHFPVHYDWQKVSDVLANFKGREQLTFPIDYYDHSA